MRRRRSRRPTPRTAALRAARSPARFTACPWRTRTCLYREGVASSLGSRIGPARPAPTTATVLKRLDAAGAIQFGVLHMTEFAYGPTGHNYHLGHCRNPWNPAYITGGSSSGSGASVAARANFAALGSDTGGSIRLPAHFCGVSGLKPTWGRVCARRDAARVFDGHGGAARAHGRGLRPSFACDRGRGSARSDEQSASASPITSGSWERPVEGLRIGVPTRYFYDSIDPAIERPVRESLDVFASVGCRIVEVEPPDLEPWNHAGTAIIAAEAAALHARWLRERPQDYSEQLRARLELGACIGAVQYINALRLRDRALKQWLAQVMSKVDALHAPVVSFATPTVAETDVGGGARMTEVLARVTRLVRPANFLGVPALAVPCGFQPNGLPCAFQLIGRPFAEALLLRLGYAYQRETDWHRRAPAGG
ncbi:MAG: amidase [Burkholderiales bacterium]|nr:amidase [Burkholderiales bacterium]